MISGYRRNLRSRPIQANQILTNIQGSVSQKIGTQNAALNKPTPIVSVGQRLKGKVAQQQQYAQQQQQPKQQPIVKSEPIAEPQTAVQELTDMDVDVPVQDQKTEPIVEPVIDQISSKVKDPDKRKTLPPLKYSDDYETWSQKELDAYIKLMRSIILEMFSDELLDKTLEMYDLMPKIYNVSTTSGEVLRKAYSEVKDFMKRDDLPVEVLPPEFIEFINEIENVNWTGYTGVDSVLNKIGLGKFYNLMSQKEKAIVGAIVVATIAIAYLAVSSLSGSGAPPPAILGEMGGAAAEAGIMDVMLDEAIGDGIVERGIVEPYEPPQLPQGPSGGNNGGGGGGGRQAYQKLYDALQKGDFTNITTAIMDVSQKVKQVSAIVAAAGSATALIHDRGGTMDQYDLRQIVLTEGITADDVLEPEEKEIYYTEVAKRKLKKRIDNENSTLTEEQKALISQMNEEVKQENPDGLMEEQKELIQEDAEWNELVKKWFKLTAERVNLARMRFKVNSETSLCEKLIKAGAFGIRITTNILTLPYNLIVSLINYLTLGIPLKDWDNDREQQLYRELGELGIDIEEYKTQLENQRQNQGLPVRPNSQRACLAWKLIKHLQYLTTYTDGRNKKNRDSAQAQAISIQNQMKSEDVQLMEQLQRDDPVQYAYLEPMYVKAKAKAKGLERNGWSQEEIDTYLSDYVLNAIVRQKPKNPNLQNSTGQQINRTFINLTEAQQNAQVAQFLSQSTELYTGGSNALNQKLEEIKGNASTDESSNSAAGFGDINDFVIPLEPIPQQQQQQQQPDEEVKGGLDFNIEDDGEQPVQQTYASVDDEGNVTILQNKQQIYGANQVQDIQDEDAGPGGQLDNIQPNAVQQTTIQAPQPFVFNPQPMYTPIIIPTNNSISTQQSSSVANTKKHSLLEEFELEDVTEDEKAKLQLLARMEQKMIEEEKHEADLQEQRNIAMGNQDFELLEALQESNPFNVFDFDLFRDSGYREGLPRQSAQDKIFQSVETQLSHYNAIGEGGSSIEEAIALDLRQMANMFSNQPGEIYNDMTLRQFLEISIHSYEHVLNDYVQQFSRLADAPINSVDVFQETRAGIYNQMMDVFTLLNVYYQFFDRIKSHPKDKLLEAPTVQPVKLGTTENSLSSMATFQLFIYWIEDMLIRNTTPEKYIDEFLEARLMDNTVTSDRLVINMEQWLVTNRARLEKLNIGESDASWTQGKVNLLLDHIDSLIFELKMRRTTQRHSGVYIRNHKQYSNDSIIRPSPPSLNFGAWLQKVVQSVGETFVEGVKNIPKTIYNPLNVVDIKKPHEKGYKVYKHYMPTPSEFIGDTLTELNIPILPDSVIRNTFTNRTQTEMNSMRNWADKTKKTERLQSTLDQNMIITNTMKKIKPVETHEDQGWLLGIERQYNQGRLKSQAANKAQREKTEKKKKDRVEAKQKIERATSQIRERIKSRKPVQDRNEVEPAQWIQGTEVLNPSDIIIQRPPSIVNKRAKSPQQQQQQQQSQSINVVNVKQQKSQVPKVEEIKQAEVVQPIQPQVPLDQFSPEELTFLVDQFMVDVIPGIRAKVDDGLRRNGLKPTRDINELYDYAIKRARAVIDQELKLQGTKVKFNTISKILETAQANIKVSQSIGDYIKVDPSAVTQIYEKPPEPLKYAERGPPVELQKPPPIQYSAIQQQAQHPGVFAQSSTVLEDYWREYGPSILGSIDMAVNMFGFDDSVRGLLEKAYKRAIVHAYLMYQMNNPQSDTQAFLESGLAKQSIYDLIELHPEYKQIGK